MNINNIDELIDFNKKFAENYIKKNRRFTPQVVISVNGQVIPIIISGGRYTIKNAISTIKRLKDKLDWLVVMHEGYMEKDISKADLNKKYKNGGLEERYLSGDTRIKWVFILQSCWKEKLGFIKKMRVYKIEHISLDFILESDMDEFEGFLKIDL
jgi:hypothetical protein